MSKKTLFALLVVLLVVLAPYTVLPALLELVVARAFQSQLGLEQTPEVEVESSPAPVMYAGSFSKALVSAEGVGVRNVKIKKVVMELDPFNLNILESVSSGKVSTEKPLSGKLDVELSEDNVSRLAQVGAGVPVQEVELEDGQVVLSMATSFGAPVTVGGRLLLQDGMLVFEPQQVEQAPPLVSPDQVLALTGFAYPANMLPYGAKITGVEVGKDSLTLSGEIQNIPLEGPIG